MPVARHTSSIRLELVEIREDAEIEASLRVALDERSRFVLVQVRSERCPAARGGELARPFEALTRAQRETSYLRRSPAGEDAFVTCVTRLARTPDSDRVDSRSTKGQER